MKNMQTAMKNYVFSSDNFHGIASRLSYIRKLAQRFDYGDTFIAEDMEGLINCMTLGHIVKSMSAYGLSILEIETPHGSVLRDDKGRAIAKTTCNVYRFNANSREVLDTLASVITSVHDYIDNMIV